MDKQAVKVILTAKDTQDRLAVKKAIPFEPDTDGIENQLINIYEEISFQEIEGFGGAFTEAASTTLDRLSQEKRNEILKAYFDPDTGIGYSLCRTHINSCDFSLGNYAYVEDCNDIELKTFSIVRDKKSLIPLIKDAISVKGSEIKLFASPWSPPAWMKTTGIMNHGGKLKDEYRELWARYFARYIKEYENEGVKIWGVTIQNEPKATQIWDSCIYTAEDERDFVRDYLGPILLHEGLGHIKIMIWDHNKERLYERAKVALSDSRAAKYIWGVGFHWYSGDHFEGLEIMQKVYPEVKLLMTEGCVEFGVKFGSWNKGERYGHDILGDLNHGTAGWVDWNMVLDEIGGPNHVKNYCDAPIIADTKAGNVHYESSYYYIGHFSKFIKPGAKRIAFTKYTDKLEVTAFINPDGEIIVIIMNQNDIEIPFCLRNQHGLAKAISLPHSIMTLAYR